jgi:MFS family permease
MIAAQFLRRDPGGVPQENYGSAIKQEVVHEQVRGIPLRQAIRTKQFWFLGVMFFCVGFPIHAIVVHIVIYATGLGISTVSAANILVVIGALNTFGRLLMGVSSDRIGNKVGLLVVYIVLLGALLLLLFAKELNELYIFAILLGFAYGSLVPLMSTVAAQLFGLRSHGALLGIYTFFFSGLGAGGPIMAGRVFDVSGSYQTAFLVFAGLGAIGLILTLVIGPVREKIRTE